MSDFVQIVTTCDQRDVLQQLAQHLVNERLAACVQIGGPVESVYRWQGKIESSQEWFCWIKTETACAERVRAAIEQQHPYDEPEIIVTPIIGGSDGYLQWIAGQTRAKPSD